MKKKNRKKDISKLFLPYYVDKNRLLDIYSILNGGYEEYIEITTSDELKASNSKKLDVNASAGFNLINIGGNASLEKINSTNNSIQVNRKRVQTLASMTDIVIKDMKNRNLLEQLSDKSQCGEFVEVNVEFIKNSVKGTIEEVISIMKLLKTLVPKQPKSNYSELMNVAEIFPEDYGIELVYETGDLAIIGYVNWNNLYQSTPYDIINNELTCLCQIKGIYPEGTELFKHSYVPKLDSNTKKELLKSIEDLTKENTFTFDSSMAIQIDNKPVYEVEIVALYKVTPDKASS